MRIMLLIFTIYTSFLGIQNIFCINFKISKRTYIGNVIRFLGGEMGLQVSAFKFFFEYGV